MRTLSTHVLDSASGRPAVGVQVLLESPDPASGDWRVVGTGHTDQDGRLTTWGATEPGLAESGLTEPGLTELEPGNHRLSFDTGAWFAAQGRDCFYPHVSITFTVSDDGHHHVPLLLAAYAYSTYRGS